MKKIITFCFFAFALVLGTQTMSGQTMEEINQAAFTKTQELRKVIKFDSETEDAVYELCQAYEKKMYNVKKMDEAGDASAAEMKNKVEAMFVSKLEKILPEWQFEIYKTHFGSEE